jgi:formate dehydrogenase accessory protein FdhD
MSVNVQIEKIDLQSHSRQITSDKVALEAPVNIFVNEKYVITLLSTPSKQEALAIGWLFTENVLQSIDQIAQITTTEDTVKVSTHQPIEDKQLRTVSVSRLLTTACGLSTRKYYQVIGQQDWPPIESPFQIEAHQLPRMMEVLNQSQLFQCTGGVHAAALIHANHAVFLAEDVGRHNAVDKVIGEGVQAGINFSESILVSSGRQPADMVLKAARMGIPIVVSRAAPIRSGIIAADKTGVTLVCFLRDQRMNVYTHHNRIVTKTID